MEKIVAGERILARHPKYTRLTWDQVFMLCRFRLLGDVLQDDKNPDLAVFRGPLWQMRQDSGLVVFEATWLAYRDFPTSDFVYCPAKRELTIGAGSIPWVDSRGCVHVMNVDRSEGEIILFPRETAFGWEDTWSVQDLPKKLWARSFFRHQSLPESHIDEILSHT